MSLSQCPVCHEEVAVPDSLPAILRQHADPEMRCPWCGEQTPLRQLRVTPMIEIVDRDGHPLPIDGLAGGGGLSGGAIAEAEFQSADVDGFDSPGFAIDTGDNKFQGEATFSRGGDSTPALELDESEFQLADPPASPMVGGVDTGLLKTSASPRKKSSPMKSMLGFLAGPPIAAVLGYFILSAVGRVPDLGFWPFNGSDNAGRSTRVAAAPVQPAVDRPRPQPMQQPVPMTMPEPVGEEPAVASEPAGGGFDVAELSMDSGATSIAVEPPTFDDSVDVLAESAKATQILRKLPTEAPEKIRGYTIRTYVLLSKIAGGGPERARIQPLIDALKQSPQRDLLQELGPSVIPGLARRGSGLFFIGERIGDRIVGNGDVSMRLMVDDDAAAGDGPVMVFGVVNEDSSAIRASIVEGL